MRWPRAEIAADVLIQLAGRRRFQHVGAILDGVATAVQPGDRWTWWRCDRYSPDRLRVCTHSVGQGAVGLVRYLAVSSGTRLRFPCGAGGLCPSGEARVMLPQIDWTASIQISHALEFVVVMIPLVGCPSELWLDRFQTIPRASQLPVALLRTLGRLWI